MKHESKIQELHLDLDGLFADFDGRVKHLSRGKLPKEMDKRHMWATINKDREFFGSLELIEGSWALWEAIKELVPDHKIKFLTGAPQGAHYHDQKRAWVKRVFGDYETNVVRRRDKQLWSGPCKVLIDDTEGNLHDWIVKGGHGIHHKDNFDDTIRALVEYHEALKA